MIDVKDLIVKRAPKFIVGNLIGTVVDTLVLWFFSHVVFHGYVGQIIISPTISFECAVSVNFLLCCRFIWKDRVKQTASTSIFRRFLAYNFMCVGGFVVKMGFLMLIEFLTHWDVVICNLLALCVSGTFNFMMSEFVIFKKRKEQ